MASFMATSPTSRSIAIEWRGWRRGGGGAGGELTEGRGGWEGKMRGEGGGPLIFPNEFSKLKRKSLPADFPADFPIIV